jgi:transcriptional regulator of acetoin/glycerol metabolism
MIDPSSKGHFEFITRAHRRSESAGLKERAKIDFAPAPSTIIRELVEKNVRLRNSALPFMETLREQIVSTHSMVILTDATGTIIEALGDDEFLEKAQKVALQPGVQWSEDVKGTNAIGTALIEELPTVVHAQDHFLHANHFLTCSAAPIFDPEGLPLGVLDVTGDYRSYHRHTMGLVRMSAQMIENQLFNSSFQDAIIVQFHQRGEFLGSAVEGAAAFSPAGKFLAANRVAMIQFGMSQAALRMHTFSSLFGMPLSGLIDHYRACNPENLTLCLQSGNQVIARATLGSIGRSKIFNAASLVKHGTENPSPCTTTSTALGPGVIGNSGIQKNRNLSSLKYLNTGDAQVARVIEKVCKVIDKDIPILILGETGTGKEILAQAIHNDSPRNNNPFVAVNCASIPETLIESELFGYEDGAFTGAKKKGSQGKIIQANGGTLFLDEIGDMPISLQARLLRVLQERVVTPLGSQKSYPVNLMVICATHRNLRDQIASGHFREDLYYRLHGLVVKLPALRERTDLPKIVQRILENESENPDLAVSNDVMNAFNRHCWPGNIRQLTNILRTASVMASDRATITWDDLPDDFLDEYKTGQTRNICAKQDEAFNEFVAEPPPVLRTVGQPNTIGSTNSSAASTSDIQAKNKINRPDNRFSPASAGKPQFSIRTNLSTNHGNYHEDEQRFQTAPNPVRTGFSITSHQKNPKAILARNLEVEQQSSAHTGNPLSKFRESRFQSKLKPVQVSAPMPYSNLELKAQGYLGGARQATQRPASMNLDDLESQAIQEALESCRGNVSAAARMLGISRNTIYRRLNTK